MSANQSTFYALQQEINARDKVQGINPMDILNLPPHPIRIGTKNRYGG